MAIPGLQQAQDYLSIRAIINLLIYSNVKY